jgi:hypothetical protein
VLCIVVQVTVFLIIASLALWVNQLFEGVIASLSKTTNIFRGTSIVSLVLALPWFILVRSQLSPFLLWLTKLACTGLECCPQGKQAIDDHFFHLHRALYCLDLQHVRLGRLPPHFRELAILSLSHYRKLVRSRSFPWSERFVPHAIRSGGCFSTYVRILSDTQTVELTRSSLHSRC